MKTHSRGRAALIQARWLSVRLLAVLLSLAAGAGGWVGFLQLSGNVHAVVPGVVYRSAQLDAEELTDLIHDEGIRAVLNLRGRNPGSPWYDAEIAASAAAGVEHIDLSLSSKREPDGATLATLIDVLRTAPKPLLIHCQGGADRSGLAAALFLLKVAGLPSDEAAGQLSFLYGHVPWLITRTGAMDRTFWMVAGTPAVRTGPS